MGASAEDETFVTFDIFVLFCLEIIIKMLIPFILLASFTLTANGHAIHQDTRCNCICPDPSVTQAESISAAVNLPSDFVPREIGDRRSIYINSTVSPDDCNCGKVVLIHLNLTDAQADSFCPRCVCKYQTSSLAIIKVVVILVVWVVLLLLFYMAFLSSLEPILNKKRCAGLPGLDRNISYREHHDADTDGKKMKLLNMFSTSRSLERKNITMLGKINRKKSCMPCFCHMRKPTICYDSDP